MMLVTLVRPVDFVVHLSTFGSFFFQPSINILKKKKKENWVVGIILI